jgi:hypothetical protein
MLFQIHEDNETVRQAELFIKNADIDLKNLKKINIGIFYPSGERISRHLMRYVGSRGDKPQLRPPCLPSAAISTRE